ncbi:MAG TPA: hypothetical protein VEB41_01125 [Burkholderiales bacterium]|nr:hypothetical protein [Burkholderiales bacterium]
MDPNSVLSKTEKGAREIETRENKLDHRLRALLIMVNGRATAGEIAAKFSQLGDISPMLDQLIAQGFISAGGTGAAASARAPAAASAAPGLGDLKRAQQELCMHLRNALGPDADLVTAKIEACKTLDELRAYFNSQRDTLSEWLGKQKSAHFWARAEPYLK